MSGLPTPNHTPRSATPQPPPTTWLALAGADPAPLLAWLQPGLSAHGTSRATATNNAAQQGPTHLSHPTHLAGRGTHAPSAAAAGQPHLVLLCTPEHWPTLQRALHAALAACTPQPNTTPPSAHASAWPVGFHRLVWGNWHLTVCLGNVASNLVALACHAQHVWLASQHSPAPDAATGAPPTPCHLPRALARVCAHHATLTSEAPPHASHASTWAQAGWVLHAPQTAVYQPRWPVPAFPQHAQPHALVVGAGLAGAALCASLTQRGWQVDLLDQHPGPAQGASALPVGMLSEHATASETVLSELSRAGMAMHLRELQALVPMGAGWQPTQVSNLRPDSDNLTNGKPPQAVNQSALAGQDTAALLAQQATQVSAIPAAMVRPAALVQAWLAQAQATGLLRTHWGSAVDSLRASNGPQPHWQALNAQGQVLAQAPHVVVAAAHGSASLLSPHMAAMDAAQPLRPVKGQMTYAPLVGEPFAPHPLRDHGVYVPCYQDIAHPTAPRLWAMGSTYERGQDNRAVTEQAQARNAASLQAMLPQAHQHLCQQQNAGELLGWAEVRCASLDRLPLVGAVPAAKPALTPTRNLASLARVPGLWTLCALGSRGLTLSKLAAELLVARMLGEPLPMEKRHADALDPARFALKACRKAQSAEKI